MKRKVLELRPTQLTVGMKEVNSRVKHLLSFKRKALHSYLESHPVPIVLAPRARSYLIDHHHLARACWEAGLDELFVTIEADFSKLSFGQMWEHMRRRHWLFPYDQWGSGPHDPIQLPESVRCMADDPYRSMAWRVREEGGYRKVEVPFTEFQWADFFRKHLKVHPIFDHFESAVKEAVALARAPAAAHLPGYIPFRN